jgi:ankyrin repeat protein
VGTHIDDALSAAVEAIRGGDIVSLSRLLLEKPRLTVARVDGQRTLLHVATDWPGRLPNSAAAIAALARHGANVNAAFIGGHSETPLHWAASCNDVAALDALLDHGASIEASGGVIGNGTPLADAVAFGQWDAARRLIDRGARPNLWQAAALGVMPRVEEYFAGDPPTGNEVTNAFWCACHGGQRVAAEYLLERGADVNWVGHDALSPLDAAERSGAADVARWLRTKGATSANVAD